MRRARQHNLIPNVVELRSSRRFVFMLLGPEQQFVEL